MRCLENAKVKYKIQVHNQQKGQRETDRGDGQTANDESRNRPDNPIAIAIHFTIVHWCS